MEAKLQYKATSSSGDNVSKTFSYINPQATDAQMWNAIANLNNLTTNSLVSVTKIVYTDLEAPDEP